jgi:hypothetical protein
LEMEAHETDEAKRWAEEYAERSGVTVDFLREHGREVRACDCGEPDCEGWQMAHVREDAWFAEQMSKSEV